MIQLIKIAANDFRLIFRDLTLWAFIVLPFIMVALIVWIVPPLVSTYEFLIPYLPVFIVIGVIENTQAFCFIGSMIFIEEKETGVAKTYGVIPVNKYAFVLSRLAFPFLVTMVFNIVFLLVQPFYQIGLITNLLISALAALVVPVYVLAMNVLAQNKVQGMVYAKVFNVLVLLPVAIFFIPEAYKYFFAVFPTFWLFTGIDQHLSAAPFGVSFAVGNVLMLALMWWLTGLFASRHFE